MEPTGERPCLLCDAAAHGVLCADHLAALERCDLTAEQLRARAGRAAALIGPFGVVLSIDEACSIGRDPDRCDVAILHPSVSASHARIQREGSTWYLIDAGSRNGSAVDDLPVTRAPLRPGARLRLGEVALYFWPSPILARPRRRRRTTQPVVLPSGFGIQIPETGARLDLWRRDAGGVLRDGERAIELTGLELRLLQVLALRRLAALDVELAYVRSTELAAELGFRSIDADGDNVRELVMRVRRKLRGARIGELIGSRRGVGYRLSADVVPPERRAA